MMTTDSVTTTQKCFSLFSEFFSKSVVALSLNYKLVCYFTSASIYRLATSASIYRLATHLIDS